MASPGRKAFPQYCTEFRCERSVSRIAEEVALRGSCRNGHEFVARDFRGDSDSAIFGGLDAHNFAEAADIHIARLRHLLWKRDNEFNLVANFEFGVSKKVKAAVTEVPRVCVQFVSFGLSRQNPHGQAHCEPPRFAAFLSISHRTPLGIVRLAQSYHRPVQTATRNSGIFVLVRGLA